MRIRYYGCHLMKSGGNQLFTVDLAPFLDKFCELDDSDFKNSFTHNGERIFIIKAESPVYLFIKTKDTDIVKAIDKEKISASEILERLERNESIGFAAYFYVGKNFLAYAATQLAPTISALGKMINTILIRLGYDTHDFHLRPIANSISREEAINMSFIGSSLIAVNRSNNVFHDIAEALGMPERAAEDVGAFEVRIRPLRRKDIKNAVTPLLHLDEKGMEKFEIRAKAELYDRMTDYRIERSLVESDEIKIMEREDIISSIKSSVENKPNLQQKVVQHEEENEVQNTVVDDFVELYTNRDWSRLLHRN